ncbi:hypothetical protein BH10BAC2_BH10BAC2_49680 [soil metagenome]
MKRKLLACCISVLLLTSSNAQIPAGEVLWLRADKNVVTDINNKVTTWKDISSNGFSVSQYNPSNQPTLVSNAFGTNPAIFFDGVHGKYFLSNSQFNLMPAGNPRTVFIVGCIDSLATANGGGDFPSAGGTIFTFRRSSPVFALQAAKISTIAATGTYVYTAGLGTNSNATADRSFFHKSKVCEFVDTYISSGSNTFLKLRQNGKPVAITQTNSIVSDYGVTGFTVGNREDFSGQDWQGYIAEIIVYDKELTEAEIEQTEKYLTDKYCCKKTLNKPTQSTPGAENIHVKLYPNPAMNNLQIEGLPSKGKTRLKIVDIKGVTKASAETTNSNFNWNISQLKEGDYILHIETNGNTITKKFMKN